MTPLNNMAKIVVIHIIIIIIRLIQTTVHILITKEHVNILKNTHRQKIKINI